MQNLVLGTAQLGMPYGIGNRAGQPNPSRAMDIVREARDHGISEFDTAQHYGTSEAVLGEALSGLGLSNRVRIISKFDPGLDHFSSAELARATDRSLKRLGIENLFGLLVHREELIDRWSSGVFQAIQPLILSGKVSHIGISVYSPVNALKALEIREIDMIQLPSNLWDRRFEKAGVFRRAQEKGKRVYIRSIYLQGLLLMDPAEVPTRLERARPFLLALDSLASRAGMTRQALALGYLGSEAPAARIVFGAETPEQVRDTCRNALQGISPELRDEVKTLFAQVPETILNPSQWV